MSRTRTIARKIAGTDQGNFEFTQHGVNMRKKHAQSVQDKAVDKMQRRNHNKVVKVTKEMAEEAIDFLLACNGEKMTLPC